MLARLTPVPGRINIAAVAGTSRNARREFQEFSARTKDSVQLLQYDQRHHVTACIPQGVLHEDVPVVLSAVRTRTFALEGRCARAADIRGHHPLPLWQAPQSLCRQP